MIRELIEGIAGYPGLFLFCCVSGILVPLPEDFPLLYAGVRIHGSGWEWSYTLAAGFSGVLIRDVLAWFFGRYLGRPMLERRFVRLWLGERRLERARVLVSSHGASAVLMGRFLVGFRAPVFMVSGAMGVPLRAFVVWDILGLVIVVPLTVGLGFYFGQPIADAVFWVLQRARVAVAIAVVVALVWVAWRARQSAVNTGSTAEDEPR